MKLIWKRNYNIKNRLYIEGLYLNDAGFETNKNISYDINMKNNCAVIKVSQKSDNKVTHNISRSGKVVPTIGIRNKAVEHFVNENTNMELFVFKGIIVLLSRNKSNKNIALCEALILKNKDIASGLKRIFKNLISFGLIDDSDLINDYIDKLSMEYPKDSLFKLIPKKVISKYKRQLRKDVQKQERLKSKNLIKTSNGFIISIIVKDDKSNNELEINLFEENDFLEFLSLNYYIFIDSLNNVKSYIKKQNSINNHIDRYFYIFRFIEFKLRFIKYKQALLLMENLIKDNILYFNTLVKLNFSYIEKNYINNRKQVKTLSPPYIKYLKSV